MARRKNPEPEKPTSLPQPRTTAPLSGVRLAPFSGDKHSCVKCGNAGAKTLYLPAGSTCAHCQNDGLKSLWGVERLHRTCERCGFAWDEACVAPVREMKETLLMPVVPSVRRDRRYG